MSYIFKPIIFAGYAGIILVIICIWMFFSFLWIMQHFLDKGE